MSRVVDKTQLANYFPFPPWQVITTRGTQEGVILKFHTYYLKIYDDDVEDSYIVESYRYGCNEAIGTDKVPANRMREYACRLGTYLQ